MANEAYTSLSRYRRLGRSGLRVSPLCLGTMTFGEEWGWGAKREECRRLVDLYLERGGNFIDTANRYTDGTSEAFLGEFLEGRRDQVVLATKYTLSMRRGDPNAAGNHRKNLAQSLEASLKRLRTHYVDLYWVHAWDAFTPVDETMRALDDAVRAGKVLYVGVSDFPAWKVAQAQTIAELRGWSPFAALQIEYSLIQRDVERELMPMARDLGIGVTPWAALGGGVLSGKYFPEDAGEDVPRGAGSDSLRREVAMNASRLSERSAGIAREVRAVARECGRTMAQIALHWCLRRPGVVSPIVGARTVAQLEDNLGCLDFVLAPDQSARLDAASAIELGWPHDFLSMPHVADIIGGGAQLDRP